jgi:hypothetical protein
VTHVTPGPFTCQPVVHARLAKVVGEVIGTPRVQDFGTPEDLECSIVERPKGLKVGATWQVYGTSGLREVSFIDSKEAFNVEASECRVHRWIR